MAAAIWINDKPMKVILNRNVAGIGKAGEIKEVSDGYAVNFLIPSKMAMPATGRNITFMAEKEKDQATRQARQVKNAAQVSKKLAGFKLELKAKADDTGTLFGSVNAAKISKALTWAGMDVKENQVKLNAPIKNLGTHKVKIQLDSNNSADIFVAINKE